MSQGTVDVDRLIEGIHEYLGKAFKPVMARIAELEKRLDTLETKGAFESLFGADDDEPSKP